MMEDPVLSALVVLRVRGGHLTGREVITAENVDDYLPDPSQAQRVLAHFAASGFQTHPIVGFSFSIEAPRSRFESLFRTAITITEGEARTPDGGLELPIASLSPEIGGSLESVSFTPRPDFGPTDY